MNYNKKDIVKCKNGFEYIITRKKESRYYGYPLLQHGSGYEANYPIEEQSIEKKTGQIFQGCVCLGGIFAK